MNQQIVQSIKHEKDQNQILYQHHKANRPTSCMTHIKHFGSACCGSMLKSIDLQKWKNLSIQAHTVGSHYMWELEEIRGLGYGCHGARGRNINGGRLPVPSAASAWWWVRKTTARGGERAWRSAHAEEVQIRRRGERGGRRRGNDLRRQELRVAPLSASSLDLSSVPFPRVWRSGKSSV